jgi:hypothetical protein
MDRFSEFLERRRGVLLAAWMLHAFLLHYFVIGFISWDGMAYRVPPAIEVVQHGTFGFEKYNQWAFAGYVPFLEMAHVPFLFVFKLPGLLVGFPLVVFPLCVAAVFALLRELTDDRRAAPFGALAYAAIPMINQQPYSGYVDFAVSGLLAYFLYAVLRLRERRTPRALLELVVATVMFTMARTQAVYVLGLIFPVIAFVAFFERRDRRGFVLALLGVVLGSGPSLTVQIVKYLRYGTPAYPFQFQLLGIKIGDGVSMRDLFSYGGLKAETPIEFLRAFVGGWIWPREWPLGAFYDSRNMGGGFVLLVAILMLPLFVRRARRSELYVVAVCLLTSLAARDFWLPRYAYTLVLALAVVIGRGLSAASALPSVRGRVAFWLGAGALVAHLARPEFDVAMMQMLDIGPRLDLTASPLFVHGKWELFMFPDKNAKLLIVEGSRWRFLVHLYGRRLTNEVIGTVPGASIGERCTSLSRYVDADPNLLVIDDDDYTKACDRSCAVDFPWGCGAWTIRPSRE